MVYVLPALKFGLILAFATILPNCSTKHTSADGGQHGGGGNVRAATTEEVKEAIAIAMKLATIEDARANYLKRFMIEWDDVGQLDTKIIFPKLIRPQSAAPDSVENRRRQFERREFRARSSTMMNQRKKLYNHPENFASEVLSALAAKTPVFMMDGPCPSPDGKHADASVSSLSKNADLCFSVSRLKRLPITGLFEEIAGLLVHEIAHLAGAQERDAVLWQEELKFFLKSYRAVRSSVAYADVINAMGDVSLRINFIQRNAINLNEERRVIEMDRIISKLRGIPYFMDPMILELSLRPKNPHLVNNFTNAVLAMIEKIDRTYRLNHFQGGMWASENVGESQFRHREYMADNPSPPPKFSEDQWQTILADLKKMYVIMDDNFLAYMGRENKSSTCVLPTQVIYVMDGGPLAYGDAMQVSPPLKCDALN